MKLSAGDFSYPVSERSKGGRNAKGNDVILAENILRMADVIIEDITGVYILAVHISGFPTWRAGAGATSGARRYFPLLYFIYQRFTSAGSSQSPPYLYH